MPQPSKGRRVRITVRVPYDLHAEAAKRAKGRRWNMSDYVGWCIEQQIRPGRVDVGAVRQQTEAARG